MSKESYAEYYRCWVANSLTIDGFAEYFGFDKEASEHIIEYGRECHDEGF